MDKVTLADRFRLPGSVDDDDGPARPPAPPATGVKAHAPRAEAPMLSGVNRAPPVGMSRRVSSDAGRPEPNFRQMLDDLFEEHQRVVEDLRNEHQMEISALRMRLHAAETPREALRISADAPDTAPEVAVAMAASEKSAVRRRDSILQLCLVVESARGLRNADIGFASGISDPYCVVDLLGRGERCRTHVVDNCLDPTWNFATILRNVSPDDTLVFTVFDHDFGSQDEALGTAQLRCEDISACGFDAELPLEDKSRNGGPQAFIHIKAMVPGAAAGELDDPSVPLARVWTSGQGASDAAKVLTPRASQIARPMDFDVAPAVKSGRRTLLFNPEARFRIVWDFMGMAALMMDMVWIPMQVFDLPQTTFAMVYAWGSLAYWMFDILMTCNTMYYGTDGTLVQSRKKILWAYLRSWLFVDLAIVVLESFIVSVTYMERQASIGEGAGAARASRMTRLARIFRMLRLMRLPKLRKAIFAIHGLIESEVMIVVFTVGRNLFGVLMCTHLIACGWFVVGDMDPRGWVSAGGFDSAGFETKYIVSLQWSLSQFTPGATPIQGTAVGERVYVVCVLAFGLVVATCFISSITSTMSALWSLGNYHRTQSVLLKKFLHQNKVPRELGYRIIRYVDFVVEFRHRRVQKSNVKYLELLSGPLQLQLKVELYLPLLGVHPLFAQIASASHVAFCDLCSAAVASTQFARNDPVFSRGKAAKEMFFVNLGSAAYRFRSAVEEERRLLDTGMWCSEVALWMPWRYRGEMKAMNSLDALSVSAAKFGDLMQSTEAYTFAQAHAISFWRKMQREESDGRSWTFEVCLLRDPAAPPQMQRLETTGRFRFPGTNTFEQRARIEVKRAEETQAQQLVWDN